jgi:hypothetical protein
MLVATTAEGRGAGKGWTYYSAAYVGCGSFNVCSDFKKRTSQCCFDRSALCQERTFVTNAPGLVENPRRASEIPTRLESGYIRVSFGALS